MPWADPGPGEPPVPMGHLMATPRLLVIGGKGGVGKTTVAAATAVHLAAVGIRGPILVASTDPAHSLGDALGVELRDPGGDPVSIRPGLDAWELCAEDLSARFFEEHGKVLRMVVDRGTILDEEDVDRFFSLTLPGIDEVMAVLEIARLVRKQRYDPIVLDTAPTGHTMRLLTLPEEMASWLRVLELMQAKHRYMVKRFTGCYRPEAGDRFIEETKRDLKELAALLTDPYRTAFIPVLIPEPMAVNETARLVNFLGEHSIQVQRIVVNRMPAPSDCPRCMKRFREAEHQTKVIAKKFAGCKRSEVPLLPTQVRGVEGLEPVACALFGPSKAIKAVCGIHCTESQPALGPSADPSDLLHRPLRFLLFGGKGGVGKTSMAAAAALRRAREHPQERILLFSTDPAHSISDSLDLPVGDQVVRVDADGQLAAMEMDAASLLETFKKDYRQAIEEAFTKLLGTQVDLPFDRPVMEELIEVSPSGLDELMALGKVMDLADDFDLFVLDTAPTGHLLRFLEMPELVASWLKVIFRVLLKYRNILSLGRLAEDLLGLSREIRGIRAALTDAEKTAFVAVAVPETLAVRETCRLLAGVSRARITCRHLVVNMVLPVSTCAFCKARRADQARAIEELSALDPGLKVTRVPVFPGEIRGLGRLQDLGKTLFGPHGLREERA